MDELTFTDPDGVEVFYRRWLPDGAPQRTVLVAHGMSEHSGRYDRFAQLLRSDGAAVFAPDHQGHGRTASATGPGRTGPSGFDGIIEDVDQLASLATESVDTDVPLVLFGHSMGAAIALRYAVVHGDRLDALILCGTPGGGPEVAELAEGLRQAVDAGMADEPVAALDVFNEAFEPARTKFDWLSRDEAEVDAYIADPLCGDGMPMTYGFLAGFMGAMAGSTEPEGLARIPASLPTLLITGEQDPASNMAAGVRDLEAGLRAGHDDVTAIYYPGARHELLNETNRDEVQGDVTRWIDEHVKGTK
ncbi:MAG: alpha/beta hydrolase [Acidimicrobiia bacterium]|nr:alpha/beta hydrolase [Acidimicrobiia bacterium]